MRPETSTKLKRAMAATLVLGLSIMSHTSAMAQESDRVCFRASAVNSFEPIDRYHLVVRVRGSSRYLLTLAHQCFDLKSTPQISFGVRGDLVCNYTRSRISTGRDMCTIKDVEEVSSVEEAKQIAAEHQAEWKAKRDGESSDATE